jgi:hypothetical protein
MCHTTQPKTQQTIIRTPYFAISIFIFWLEQITKLFETVNYNKKSASYLKFFGVTVKCYSHYLCSIPDTMCSKLTLHIQYFATQNKFYPAQMTFKTHCQKFLQSQRQIVHSWK